MNALTRYVTSVGSIAIALGMLGYGTFLIQKNTPHPKKVPVRFNPPTNPSVPEGGGDGRIQEGKYVGGVGIIEPAGEAITIGSQLPGIVARVFVSPGEQVKEGDPLLVLDDRTARANVGVARNNLKAQ